MNLMASSKETFDFVILGSGSAAFAAAIRAKELGKTAVMTEMRTLGGTCVNRGCLPSKNLIEAARLVYDAAHPRYPGLTPTQLSIDFPALVAQKDEVIYEYRDQHYNSIIDEASEEGPNPIQLVQGHAVFVDPHTVEVTAPDGTLHQLTGDQVLIATGSSPLIPGIPGLADTPYLTSDLLTSQEETELTELPRSLIVIGGGYIALELGQMFARIGTDVTILERSARIRKDYEPEISLTLTDILREEGIRLMTHARVRQVSVNTGEVQVTAEVRGQQRHFQASKLLVAAGRRPNTDGIGLERAGVQLDHQGAVMV